MSLHTSEGAPILGPAWMRHQMDLANAFSPISSPNEQGALEVISLWTACFAQAARIICDNYGVPVDVFNTAMEEFDRRIVGKFCDFKWIESCHANRDIGFAGLKERIKVFTDKSKMEIEKQERTIRDKIVILIAADTKAYFIELSVTVPNIDHPDSESLPEIVRFTITPEAAENEIRRQCAAK